MNEFHSSSELQERALSHINHQHLTLLEEYGDDYDEIRGTPFTLCSTHLN